MAKHEVCERCQPDSGCEDTCQVVLCMDADLQHRPEQMPDVAGPVLSGSAEYAIGSRHVGDGGLG